MKRRVLEVTPNPLEIGGVQTFLINVLPRMSDYEITAMFMGAKVDEGLEAQLSSCGIRVVCKGIACGERGSLASMRKALETELVASHYDIVHIHGGWIRGEACLCKAAKHAGAEVVLAHSHSATPTHSRIKRLAHPIFYAEVAKNADGLLACSRDAGCSTFGKKEWDKRGVYIANGIDLSRFEHSSLNRGSIRGEDRKNYIVGQVGRLVDQKNYQFTLKVFYELKRMVPEAKLWILGDGGMRRELEETVSILGLKESVVFFGSVTDPAPYYQDMDAFIMPSKCEGLGIALIEAEASGLPCLVSDQIPQEALLEDCNVEVMALAESPETWARKLSSFQGCGRKLGCDMPGLSKFSIDATVESLRQQYETFLQSAIGE